MAKKRRGSSAKKLGFKPVLFAVVVVVLVIGIYAAVKLNSAAQEAVAGEAIKLGAAKKESKLPSRPPISCGTVIDASWPAVIKLTRSDPITQTVCSAPTSTSTKAITLDKDGLIFDCDMKTIQGKNTNTVDWPSGEVGIAITGEDVVVKNCVIKDFMEGITVNVWHRSGVVEIKNNIIEGAMFGIWVGARDKIKIVDNFIGSELVFAGSASVKVDTPLQRDESVSILRNDIFGDKSHKILALQPEDIRTGKITLCSGGIGNFLFGDDLFGDERDKNPYQDRSLNIPCVPRENPWTARGREVLLASRS